MNATGPISRLASSPWSCARANLAIKPTDVASFATACMLMQLWVNNGGFVGLLKSVLSRYWEESRSLFPTLDVGTSEDIAHQPAHALCKV